MDSGAESYRRYLEGDDSGMVELIRDHKDSLTMYLLSITGNIFTAEESMEETFCKLVIKRPSFSGKSSFKTWLYAIGRNAALDAMRKAKRTSAPLDEDAQQAEEESVENVLITDEKRRIVRHALKKLKPDYRQALYLVYFEDMTANEAAQVMKKTRKQAENLILRARNALRLELEKEGFRYEEL